MSLMSENMESYISSEFIVHEIYKWKDLPNPTLPFVNYQYTSTTAANTAVFESAAL